MGSISRRRVTGSRQGWTGELKSGLVHLWEFDGDAVDRVGGADGTVSGTVLFEEGKVKKCACFNAAGYISVNSTIGPMNAWTVSFWLKADEEMVLAGIFFRGDSSYAYGFRISVGTFNFCNNGAGIHNTFSVNKVVYPGEWVHVVAGFPGNILKIDGVSKALGGNLGALHIPVPGLFGADGYDAVTRGLKGCIEQFGIWNRVLSGSEIDALYNAGRGLKYK
jgi:hypothetical protein